MKLISPVLHVSREQSVVPPPVLPPGEVAPPGLPPGEVLAPGELDGPEGLMFMLIFPPGELGKGPGLVSTGHSPVSCFLGQHLMLFG